MTALRPYVRLAVVACLAALARPGLAAEVQLLPGTPTAQQLEQALKPQQAAPSPVRFRGLSLGAATPGGAAQPPAGGGTAATAAVAVNINFDFDSDRLTEQGRGVLDQLGSALNSDALKPYRFQIEGHTDGRGSDVYNDRLSERRAASVKRYLVASGHVAPARLRTVGKGKHEPLDPQNPDADLNRRVQVLNLGQ